MPLNLISLVGLFVMVGLAWLMSSYRDRVNWRLVATGLGLQFVLAFIFFNSQTWTFPKRYDSFQSLKTAFDEGKINELQIDEEFASSSGASFQQGFNSLRSAIENDNFPTDSVDREIAAAEIKIARFPNGVLFYAFDSFFEYINEWVAEGSGFVFNTDPNRTNRYTHPKTLAVTFAFGVLPTVIFFASLMSVLYHIGLMERVVKSMAWVMQRVLGTSGAESLAAAANVFVGHTEAPLVVKPYISAMTRSELNAMMVGGFATITGGLMAVFVGIGISAGHLISASIISAPAALLIAKILQPETGKPDTLGVVTAKFEKTSTNVIEAAATGAGDGMKLAINIAAMLIAFLALIALVNTLIMGLGELVEMVLNIGREGAGKFDLSWSLAGMFGLLFWPLAWIMGIERKDCAVSGELLGTKMVVNEFLAYFNMGDILAGNVMNEDTGQPVKISERTQVILTYALCGFSNFGAIGIQLGGIGPLAPSRKSDIAQLGLRAMLGGMLACCMTACIAGIMFGWF